MAKLAGMCDPDNSCNINQNTGLSLAFTIAHEMGHNFNADHDSEVGCENLDKSKMNIMETNVKYESSNIAWSDCSRNSIETFLE